MKNSELLECGHTPSPHSIHTTDTAKTADGREICWACADAEQVAYLLKRVPVGGYLSADGKTATTLFAPQFSKRFWWSM